ncbi:peptidoglycan recognition protein 1-like [Macrosteles quadrilineatus]|uniref:peptidoglycan recognition protein 1-like n=1 Tax=Macrosteles quadrilineatus TaxID=74068 RepID=UPI0023E272C0|nr:peptidoglycan recognition protein 1-like [Macrosteles quadrilineatus]
MDVEMPDKYDPNIYSHWPGKEPEKPDISVKIIPRSRWEADPPQEAKLVPNTLPVTCVYSTWLFGLREIFWDDEPHCRRAIRRIQRFYMREKSQPDTPYSFIITSDGLVYEGRGWKYKPAVKTKHSCIDVAFAPKSGVKSDRAMMMKMMDAGFQLVYYGMEEGLIDKGYVSMKREVDEEETFAW